MKSLRVDGRLSFIVLLLSQLAATMGFTFVLPFMPIYVQALGVEDAGSAAAWAGVINSSTAVTMALAAPLWGRLGDRVGLKPMLLRATIAGSLLVGLMGLVGSPWQLLALKTLAGMPDRYGRGRDGPRIGDGPATEGGREAGDPADGHLRRRCCRTFLRWSIRRPRRHQGLFRGDRGLACGVRRLDLCLGQGRAA